MEFKKVMYEFLLKQGGPIKYSQGQGPILEPLFTNPQGQGSTFDQSHREEPIYTTTPLHTTKCRSIIDLEE